MLTPTWVHSCRSGVRPVLCSHRWVRRHFLSVSYTSQRSSCSTNRKSCQQVSGKPAALNPVKIREQRHQRTTMKLDRLKCYWLVSKNCLKNTNSVNYDWHRLWDGNKSCRCELVFCGDWNAGRSTLECSALDVSTTLWLLSVEYTPLIIYLKLSRLTSYQYHLSNVCISAVYKLQSWTSWPATDGHSSAGSTFARNPKHSRQHCPQNLALTLFYSSRTRHMPMAVLLKYSQLYLELQR